MLVYIVLLFSVVTMLNCQTGVSMRGFFAQDDMTRGALSRMCNTYVQENATVYDYSGQFTVYKAIKELMSRQPSYIRVSVAYAVRSLVENLLRSEYDLVTETRFLTNGVYSCCLVFQRAVVDSAVMVSYKGYNVSGILAESHSYATYYTVIKDIASLLQWKNTCVFYTDQLVHQSNTLTTVLSEIGIRFWLHSIGTGATLVKSLSNCYNAMITTDINFMLIANQSSVENILRKINILSRRHGDLAQLGLMSRWFIWGHNICVKCLQSKVQNVSNVSILQRNKLVPTSVCSEVPVYEVLTAYWQRAGRQFGRVASWTSLGHMTTYDDIFPNVRAGLNNVTLIVTTKDWAPFTIKTVVGGVAHYKGVCLDLIEEMSRRLNFSFVVVEPPDGQWGLKMLSGNWTGMIAQLANRDVDVMVAAASIQQEREEVMDFVHPFYNDYTSLLLKKPDKKLDKWKRLINPIHWVVVVCIVISLPIVTLSLVYIEKNHPCYWNINRKHRRGLHRFDDCLWYNLAALLNEGGQETPEDQAGRTVVAAWWLFTIVVVASYTSTLTAALTVEKDDLPFETIEEMTEQTDFKWGGTNGSYMFMLFQKSNNGVYKKLWAGVERFLRDDPDLLNSNYHVQMNRVKQGNYVLMNDKSVNLIEVARDCDLAITKQEFLPLNFGIGLQQNSPYKKLFQNQMISIEESGLLELWKTKWWPPMHNCTKLGPAEVKPISLADVQGGYMILGLGIFGSVFTFGLEYLLSHVSSKCRCGLCET